MWKYTIYWAIWFAGNHSSHQGGTVHRSFDTRRQIDSATVYLQAESQKHHFKLMYHIDSVKIK